MKTPKKRKTLGVPTADNGQTVDWLSEADRTYQIGLVDVDAIITEGQLVREDMNSDHVIELSNSIAAHGLLEPIVVRKTAIGYQLIAGAHRLAACKRLGWTDIPANILPSSNTAPVKSLALIENIIRRDLSLEEECQAITTLQEEQKLSTSQICDLLGKTRLWVQQRTTAQNMPTDVRDPLFEGLLSMKSAEMICEVSDEGIRKQITNQTIYQKLSSHAVRQVVDVYIATPSLSAAVEAGLQAAREVCNAPPPSTHCAACTRKVDYRYLKAVFICTDELDCSAHVMKGVESANASRDPL